MPRQKPLDPPQTQTFRLLSSEWAAWANEAARQGLSFRTLVQNYLRAAALGFSAADKRKASQKRATKRG